MIPCRICGRPSFGMDGFCTEHRGGAFARRTDPQTSHDAAQSLEVTELERQVLAAIPNDGTATLDEVCEETGLDKVTASPRFRPLEEKGLIERAGKRMGDANRMQTAWRKRERK